MKEIIGAIVVLVSLWQGTAILKRFHDSVRTAALKKADEGLPPLAPFATKLTKKPPRR